MADAAERVDGTDEQTWLTPGVAGIGGASLLADVGHEIPTALLPSDHRRGGGSRERSRSPIFDRRLSRPASRGSVALAAVPRGCRC